MKVRTFQHAYIYFWLPTCTICRKLAILSIFLSKKTNFGFLNNTWILQQKISKYSQQCKISHQKQKVRSWILWKIQVWVLCSEEKLITDVLLRCVVYMHTAFKCFKIEHYSFFFLNCKVQFQRARCTRFRDIKLKFGFLCNGEKGGVLTLCYQHSTIVKCFLVVNLCFIFLFSIVFQHW